MQRALKVLAALEVVHSLWAVQSYFITIGGGHTRYVGLASSGATLCRRRRLRRTTASCLPRKWTSAESRSRKQSWRLRSKPSLQCSTTLLCRCYVLGPLPEAARLRLVCACRLAPVTLAASSSSSAWLATRRLTRAATLRPLATRHPLATRRQQTRRRRAIRQART